MDTITNQTGYDTIDNATRRRACRWSALCGVLLAVLASTGRGQPADMPQLLPENTVAYAHVADAQEFFTQLADTAMGRMLRDPELQPIVDDLYKSATDAFRRIEDEIGLTVEQLRAIPQGETCLAAVAPDQGSPILVALIGVGDEIVNARKVVAYVQSKMVEQGATKATEKDGDTELTVLQSAGESESHTVFFEYHETIGITSDLELAKELLAVWRGKQDATTLTDNEDFTTIMKRCAGTDDEKPQVTYYVDPLGIARSIASNNMGLQMGLVLLNQHGVDGFRGFGGSLVLGGEHFESLHHMHFLVDSSRSGVLDILAPKTGDVSAEVWVPNDVATYLTFHWDIAKSYAAFAETYDRFRGVDAWRKAVSNSFVKQLGIDLQRDLVDALEGRITRISWASDPEKAGRAATMTGLKLKDAAAFEKTLARIVKRNGRSQFTEHKVTGGSYYRYQPRSTGTAGTREPAQSYVAILGDYLLLSDSDALIERAIETKRGALPPLGDELDFKLNASKISLLPGGDNPIMTSFTRPDVGLRSSYVLLQAENTRQSLSQLAGRNRMFGAVDAALTKHPLPPFHVLAKYFAFSGRLVTSDDSGIHSIGFTFRRDQ